jgi:hypothetical protein
MEYLTMTDRITKTIRLGTVPNYNKRPMPIFCQIEFDAGKLSITGVEGPKANGDAHGGCGQIVMHMDQDYRHEIDLAPGWTRTMVKQFIEAWDRWHLNDMVAGSPAQMAWLRDNPIIAVYPESHYEKACNSLAEAGLNPDPNYAHNGKPYKYGSAWLREEIPSEVVEFLASLPDTDQTPAWV